MVYIVYVIEVVDSLVIHEIKIAFQNPNPSLLPFTAIPTTFLY